MSAISHLPSEAATIKSGLVARAASYLKVPVRAVDPTITLAELGFDSLSAMELTGGAEDRWGIDADATMVFEYPTTADISGYIATEVAALLEVAA